MIQPKIAILYAPGTNCHEETAYAVESVGGSAEVVKLSDLAAGDKRLMDYAGIIVPGGFSFGDHIAAGRVFSVYLVSRFGDQLREFVAARKPVMGICNGDQVLMESGILPGGQVGARKAALTQNRSARFESRWSNLLVERTGSFWTAGLEGKILRVPVAHGEGRMYYAPGEGVIAAFRYADDNGNPTEEYPFSPAGSPGGVAGVVDPTGTILGMMPHPERAMIRAHGSVDGSALFVNMVNYCRGM